MFTSRLPLLLRRLSVPLLALLAACATLAALGPPSDKPAATTPTSASARRVRLEKASNPARLLLHDDGTKIVGWVSGVKPLAGQVVSLSATTDGSKEQTQQVKLDKDNSFRWPYSFDKPTTVRVATELPAPEGKKTGETLEQTLTLKRGAASAVDAGATSVFFVVDRTAYRPTQTLHYAGFLRKLNAKGEFEPVANQAVTVELISEKKATRAFKLQTKSDDFGRITGSHTFRDDALDHYTLSVSGYKGSARILLGEYRKSKIRLEVKGEVKSEKLKLTFEVLDFLEKKVEGTKASFTAQVVRNDRKATAPATLKASDFIHHAPLNALLSNWENMGEEEMLVWQSEGASLGMLSGGGGGSSVVSQMSGDVEMKGAAGGTHTLDLQKDWLQGGHSVIVAGVVTDAHGREQRATKTIPLGEPKCPGVTLEVDREDIVTGDRVTVRAKRADKAEAKEHAYDGPLTLVVMKLSPNASGGGSNPYFDAYGNYGGYYPGYYRRYRYWAPVPAPRDTIKRTMITAVPFSKKDGATVKLTEPGAYKFVAIGQREDGSNVRTEVGCVVKNAADLPALKLKLDKEEYSAGDRLTGKIQSRYAGARVLLTVRDSAGLKLIKPLTLDKAGELKLSEPLPTGLNYGCTVEVQYPEESGRLATVDQFVRVVPTDRILTITPTVKPVVLPGETVKLNVQVDRQEEVDLIVSVYDQSLLGIASDTFVDVKNFYLADERGRDAHARDLLRRRLGDLTIEALADKAKATLAADKNLVRTPQGQALQQLVDAVNNRVIRSTDVATAMRLAGVDALVPPGVVNYYGQPWYFQPTHLAPAKQRKTHRLADLLDHKNGEWYLSTSTVNGAVVLYDMHPSYASGPMMWRYLNNSLVTYGAYGGYQQLQSRTYRDMPQTARFAPSGNSVLSAMPEGQAVLSHIPVGGVQSVELINTDAGESHIGVRRDFSDSAYWNAKIRTDKTGRATVEFKVPDSLTNWQVVVTAVSPKMHVGQAKASFRTFKPIMIWPMLPRTFTEGDRVELFGIVHNRTDKKQTIKAKLKVENGEVLTATEKTIDVEANSNVPVYWTFKAIDPGFTQLLMTADCAAGNDASLKRLPVTRAAVEQIVTASGMVKDFARFEIPKGVDLKSSSLEVSFAPSLAADLADTLNYLVDYPYGCVEQTMSRFLPAIKVAQVLQNFQVEHPELQKKLPGCVAAGIKRLLELQQHDGGWGWHTGQTHEMMTPYALYGLLQAEKAGYAIPADGAIDRGLNRLRSFINTMTADAQTADRIYCMHVLAHRHDLDQPWWDWIAQQAKAKKLSHYALALALETAVQKGKKDLADTLAKELRAQVKKAGSHHYWETAGFSRWGDDKFEVTAAAMKALVAHDHKDPLLDGVLSFFVATKRGNRWNSTKDTAMILFAMCDFLAKERFDPKAKAELSFALNRGAAQKVTFTDKLTRKVTVPAAQLKHGVNELSFDRVTPGMMYRVVFRYWEKGAEVAPMEAGIKVSRKFYLLNDKGEQVRQLKSGDEVPRGSYILSEVNAENTLKTDMRYVLVENPKPACAETLPVEDARFTNQQHSTAYALREERLSSVAFHHEQTGSTLIDRCVLLAELAGDYLVPPAQVELMYQTEMRGHSGTFVLKVAEKK